MEAVKGEKELSPIVWILIVQFYQGDLKLCFNFSFWDPLGPFPSFFFPPQR